MHEVYYIGGPWDMTKRVMDGDRPPELHEKIMYCLDLPNPGLLGRAEIRMGYCYYTVSKVARNNEAKRDVYIAIFGGW